MSTFTAIPVLLKTLLERVKNGKVKLPDFQRGWVWDDERIKGLLISISRGFPVGAVMTLDAGGDIRFQSRVIEGVDDNGIEQTEHFLLDGQQRLTSLYQAMLYEGPVETRDRPGGSRVIKRWYYVDMQKVLDPLADHDERIISIPEDRIVRTNFGRDVQLDLSTKEHEFEHHMIPTEDVLDGMGWGFKYAEYWLTKGGHPDRSAFDYFTKFKNAVLENFTEYQLPVINLGKETPKEAVCTVFEKVNTGGVTLSVFELVTASFAADSFSLRDDWANPPIPSRLYDSIINKTPIDALTNRKLGGQRPSRYLQRLRQDIDGDKLKRILHAHWINLADIEQDRFGDCFVERGQAMLDLINRAMRKPQVDGRSVFRNALDSAGLASDQYGIDEDVEYDPIGDSAYGLQ